VDSSTTRTYGGTGLGLAISKQVGELGGGGATSAAVAGLRAQTSLDSHVDFLSRYESPLCLPSAL
jgi:signal transduction histidine kinase